MPPPSPGCRPSTRKALEAVRDGRAQTLRRAAVLQRREDRQRPAEGGRVADLWALVERGITFGTIYADPPWLYDNQATRAATANHYDGMTVDELALLPVGRLAAKDAHLHLWTTNGFLFDCPRLFDAWGFTFKTSFVWVKTPYGTGNYWRSTPETGVQMMTHIEPRELPTSVAHVLTRLTRRHSLGAVLAALTAIAEDAGFLAADDMRYALEMVRDEERIPAADAA